MKHDSQQQLPDPQSIIWILWVALLTTTFTFSFVILKIESTMVKDIDENQILSIAAGVALFFAFISKIFYQKASRLLAEKKQSPSEEEHRKHISKTLTPYVISWALGTEVVAIIGVYLRFYGGANFTQYALGFIGAAFVLHITNRPRFSFKA